jgi:hypothetical protein
MARSLSADPRTRRSISDDRKWGQFGAAAAAGCLSGALALVGFCVAYAWTACRRGWGLSLLGSISAYGLVAAAVSRFDLRSLPLFCLVLLSLAASLAWMPVSPTDNVGATTSSGGIALRIAAATVIVLALTDSARRLGPSLSGILASLPVYAGTLTAFAQHFHDSHAAVAMLRGLPFGLFAYATFFLVLTVLMVHSSPAVSFLAALLGTFAVQGCS